MGNYAGFARELVERFRGERAFACARSTRRWPSTSDAIDRGARWIWRWGGGAPTIPTPDTFVYVAALGRRASWAALCGSPEIDRLAERGRAETTPVQRHALYRQVEETMAREALLLPLFHEQVYRFAQPDVGGLNVSFGIPLVTYEELHLRG